MRNPRCLGNLDGVPLYADEAQFDALHKAGRTRYTAQVLMEAFNALDAARIEVETAYYALDAARVTFYEMAVLPKWAVNNPYRKITLAAASEVDSPTYKRIKRDADAICADMPHTYPMIRHAGKGDIFRPQYSHKVAAMWRDAAARLRQYLADLGMQ